MNLLMSEECYNKIVKELDIFHVECFLAILSKLLGYSVVLGALLVKTPQIYKVVLASSAQGLSFSSLLFEMYAVTCILCYSFAKDFPFSAWGDSFFVVLQDTLLGFLIQYYEGKPQKGAVFALASWLCVFILTSGITPVYVLAALHASNVPAIAVSKLMQAWKVYENGRTGQLSAITVFLLFYGSVARIFTSFQDTGDVLVIITYLVASLCNGILVFQMIWYWKVKEE